ncbi:Glycosyl hydrolases family 43 [Pedobacter westerhofensis]|uniref:Glycosyl hydrolases family 43 n=1 Tax=Pedobacter westerhofensis TaxID=425512 RepID=A0A521AM58_9SPHI|nr:glycoside hydrolase family 43 protein [Pedobacter westerhofensis]SMO35889.1 Glycosyl hydrolases family 43 [Pedobacter westerhofensis]
MRNLLIILLFCCCSCTKEVYLFTSFHEPANEGLRFLYSTDGYHWKDLGSTFLKPEAGAQKVMRDPSIARGPDGVYHLVWTSSWKGDKGFGYAFSKDLVHWSPQQMINVMAHEPDVVNVWAPEIFYDEQGQQFIIIWASTVPYRFPKGTEEENNNHRMYYTLTKDFVNFSEAKLFLDPGFSVIDAVIARRRSDGYVLVLKDNTRANRNLKVAFSPELTGPYTNISAPFSGKLTEGPSVVQVGQDWLIYYDAYGEKRYAAYRTRDFKSFTDISAEIDIPAGHKHGTVFKSSRRILKGLQQQANQKLHPANERQ